MPIGGVQPIMHASVAFYSIYTLHAAPKDSSLILKIPQIASVSVECSGRILRSVVFAHRQKFVILFKSAEYADWNFKRIPLALAISKKIVFLCIDALSIITTEFLSISLIKQSLNQNSNKKAVHRVIIR